MSENKITSHRTVSTVMTGYFQCDSAYRTWRPAGTDDYLLLYTVGGNGRVGSTGQTDLVTKTGDIALIRPNIPHDYGTASAGRWDLLWAHFRPPPDWVDLLDWPFALPGVHIINGNMNTLKLLRQTHELALVDDPLRDRLAMNALEGFLLSVERINPRRDEHQSDPRLRDVIAHISMHLHQPLSIDILAEVAGLSPSRLAHAFRHAYGLPPMQYVESRRIARARQLLKMTPLNIKQVAHQVGYENPFYFSLRFKHLTGKNPTEYRGGRQL